MMITTSRSGRRSTNMPCHAEQASAPDQLGELRQIVGKAGRCEPALAEHPAQDEIGNLRRGALRHHPLTCPGSSTGPNTRVTAAPPLNRLQRLAATRLAPPWRPTPAAPTADGRDHPQLQSARAPPSHSEPGRLPEILSVQRPNAHSPERRQPRRAQTWHKQILVVGQHRGTIEAMTQRLTSRRLQTSRPLCDARWRVDAYRTCQLVAARHAK